MPFSSDARARSASAARFRRLNVCVIAGLAAGVVIGGCDTSTDQANRSVDQKVAAALPKVSGSEQDRNQAHSLLDQAAAEAAASNAERIRAKSLLAQVELRAAEDLQPRIESTQAQIDQLAWDIRQMGGQIQASNRLASSLAMYNPANVQTAIQGQVADVQGSPDKTDWVKSDTGSIQTLAAVNKDITDLQSQITDLQNTVKTLSDQRTLLQAKADQLSQQSEKEKGDKAVELFKQAADARKQADDLAVQIDQNNVKLTRAQTDLGVKQGQQEVLAGAVKSFGDMASQVDSAWKILQDQMKAQTGQAASILGEEGKSVAADDPTGGSTIASKSERIADLAKANRSLRDEAEGHLNSSIQFFTDAAGYADQLQRELASKLSDPKMGNAPDAAAWRTLSHAFDPAHFRLQQSNALLHRAALLAGKAAEANQRLQLVDTLKPILADAKLALPGSLQDNDNKIADDLKNGREQADLSYKASDELVSGIPDGTAPDDVKNAARVASIFTQYGWYLLASSVGDKQSDDHLKAALAQRDAAVQNNVHLGNLPPELAGSPAPTTAPAAAPTAAPAAGT